MMLVRCNPMMNAGRSAAYGAGDSCSCAYFQASNTNAVFSAVDTMVMVSIFLILAVGVLFGTLALMIPGAIFLTLISAGLHNLNTP